MRQLQARCSQQHETLTGIRGLVAAYLCRGRNALQNEGSWGSGKKDSRARQVFPKFLNYVLALQGVPELSCPTAATAPRLMTIIFRSFEQRVSGLKVKNCIFLIIACALPPLTGCRGLTGSSG